MADLVGTLVTARQLGGVLLLAAKVRDFGSNLLKCPLVCIWGHLEPYVRASKCIQMSKTSAVNFILRESASRNTQRPTHRTRASTCEVGGVHQSSATVQHLRLQAPRSRGPPHQQCTGFFKARIGKPHNFIVLVKCLWEGDTRALI